MKGLSSDEISEAKHAWSSVVIEVKANKRKGLGRVAGRRCFVSAAGGTCRLTSDVFFPSFVISSV